jgi:hypothetical protein
MLKIRTFIGPPSSYPSYSAAAESANHGCELQESQDGAGKCLKQEESLRQIPILNPFFSESARSDKTENGEAVGSAPHL